MLHGASFSSNTILSIILAANRDRISALRRRAAVEGFQVKTGIDLVKLDEFRRSLESGGETMLKRLFHPSEASADSLERLAGIFAAKEAAFKALGMPRGNWHIVEIKYDREGKPGIIFAPEFDRSLIISVDVSIAHAGEYAIACVTALVRE
ncbi:MAG: acpS [Dehalococcoidia bacterium]|nr:acpS [Dehalococcoidia bacterium]